MQNGAGLIMKIENSRATAVIVRSPPESRVTDWGRFPGGRAIMSMPHSSGSSSPSSSTSLASPPPKSRVNIVWKFLFACSNVVRKRSDEVVLRLVMSSSIWAFAARRSSSCAFSLAYRSSSSRHSSTATMFTGPSAAISDWRR